MLLLMPGSTVSYKFNVEPAVPKRARNCFIQHLVEASHHCRSDGMPPLLLINLIGLGLKTLGHEK